MDKQLIHFLRSKPYAILCLLFIFLSSFQFISKGVTYEHRTLSGPVSVHILDVDPAIAKIKLVTSESYPLHLETTSSIALKNRALAAINGGFFRRAGSYAGTSYGTLKIDDDWISFTSQARGAIGWNGDGKDPIIDRLNIQAHFLVKSKKYPLMGLNQPRQPDEAILYKFPFYSSTLTSSLDPKEPGKEIVVDATGQITGCFASDNNSLPSQGYIYSMGPALNLKLPTKCKDLSASYVISLWPIFNPTTAAEWKGRDHILGGAPVLVAQGKTVSDFSAENVGNTLLNTKNARTAVGIKNNGHWVFAVVDGNQPESLGMSMAELSQYMLSLGCVYALNLDGSGSSTMYLKDKIVNIPSGNNSIDPDEATLVPLGREQPVSNAILIFDIPTS